MIEGNRLDPIQVPWSRTWWTRS